MSRHVRKPRTGTDRTSFYDDITRKIIAELEAGCVPWVQPWGTAKAPFAMPRNAATRRRYGGINILILLGAAAERGFSGQSWLTFRQALALGGCVRKGERGTVVSFAVISDYFPTELVGRANGALNVLHFGWAFLAQYATGLILEQWSTDDGQRSIMAYQIAFGLNVAVQFAALAWFALPWIRSLFRCTESFLLHMPFTTFDAIQPEIVNEQTNLLMPVDEDAKW
jgi:hypothetical protein